VPNGFRTKPRQQGRVFEQHRTQGAEIVRLFQSACRGLALIFSLLPGSARLLTQSCGNNMGRRSEYCSLWTLIAVRRPGVLDALHVGRIASSRVTALSFSCTGLAHLPRHSRPAKSGLHPHTDLTTVYLLCFCGWGSCCRCIAINQSSSLQHSLRCTGRCYEISSASCLRSCSS